MDVPRQNGDRATAVTLFLCGDVMTGRGIDQILSHPGDPVLHEPYVDSAAEYVRLAEVKNGPIPRRSGLAYIWGDALGELQRAAPDLRVINLETAVTTSNEYDVTKQIHYRMHPANIGCVTAAGVNCCVLANNHVLDWGRAGLLETVETLSKAGLKAAGAGRNLDEAARPAVFDPLGKGRVLVFACGCRSAGIPAHWAATDSRPGVWLIDEESPACVVEIANRVRRAKQPADIVVVSIHWGGNWGYEIPGAQTAFAHNLIDRASVDVIHGHSSHHVKALEVYRGKPILYGCGDLLTDYEGIAGREEFRDDLGLLYLLTIDLESRIVTQLEMTPTLLQRFRLTHPNSADTAWLMKRLNRDGRRWGTTVKQLADKRLALHWEE
jgi:poly-gamma-glutamate capsule biosynthesis protein CapA/YwtB (metallophosphatase superfamily)